MINYQSYEELCHVLQRPNNILDIFIGDCRNSADV